MRCFAAIDLPDEFSEKLREIQSRLKAFGLKASFTRNHHLTLKFLGELSRQKAEHVKKALGRVRMKKFSVSLDGIGVFPGESSVRVVWAGLSPEDRIKALKKQIDESLQKDFEKDRDFKAHVTLARVKYVKDREKFLKFLESIEVNEIKFEVSGFKLKKSTLTTAGPVYEDLAYYGQSL